MSLLRLALKDFVIVRELDLELKPGFTALTGETGAGKSILIDALQLALGGRADATAVRQGQSRAEVCAEFEPTDAVNRWLTEQDLSSDEGTVLLRRTVDAQGRSKGWINGSPVSAAQLRELGEHLVDIHGQHAWQALTRPDAVRALLDEYAGIDTTALAQAWHRWRQACEALADAEANQGQAQARREHLQWLLEGVAALAPGASEWEELQTEHQRLAHMHQLLEAAAQALERLQDGETNALGLLHQASQALQARCAHEPAFEPWLAQLEQAAVLQRDVVRALRAYSRQGEADPAQLAHVERRIAQWLALARRLGCAPQDVVATATQLQSQLEALSADTDTEALRETADHSRAELLRIASEISARRQTHQALLATEITERMQELGMKGGRFEVALLPLGEPQAAGLEAVEFRVAGHAGVTPRPLGKVASGGELSRIALAISVATSRLKGCPTLIFDEVDSGVGGAVAHTVGRLMAELGRHRQVLAVTHLPQVAACARFHLRVSKSERNGEVVSDVIALNASQRVDEIARMLGGAQVTDTTRAHALEMLRP